VQGDKELRQDYGGVQSTMQRLAPDDVQDGAVTVQHGRLPADGAHRSFQREPGEPTPARQLIAAQMHPPIETR
jgi:hypothetical protein